MSKKCAILLTLIICFFALGCVSETADGSTKIFKFELWVIGLLAGVGIAAGIGGWFLRRLKPVLGWILFLGGPLFLVFVLPGMYMEHVTVSPGKVTRVGGFWFSQTTEEINLDDVISIEIIVKESRGRRGRKNKDYYIVFSSRGKSTEIALGEIMEVAAVEIIQRAKDRNIIVRDLTGM